MLARAPKVTMQLLNAAPLRDVITQGKCLFVRATVNICMEGVLIFNSIQFNSIRRSFIHTVYIHYTLYNTASPRKEYFRLRWQI